MKIDLPGEGWAHLREPDDITERQRRAVTRLQRQFTASGMGQLLARMNSGEIAETDVQAQVTSLDTWVDDAEKPTHINDAIAATVVKEWSFDPDVSAEGMQDLPAKAYRALVDACHVVWAQVGVATTDEDVLDPASPTEPVNG